MGLGLAIQAAWVVGTYIYNRWMVGDDDDNKSPEFQDFDVVQSIDQRPVALVWGRDRVSPLGLTWFDNPYAKAFPSASPDDKSITTVQYGANFQLVVCLGSGVTAKYARWLNVWAGDSKLRKWSAPGSVIISDSFQTFAPAQAVMKEVRDYQHWGGAGAGGGVIGKLRFHGGSPANAADEKMLETVTDAPNFNGFVHMVFGTAAPAVPVYFGTRFILGESARMPPISAEIELIPDALGHPNVGGSPGPDANPAEVIYDILTNDWGRAGLPSADIDSTSFLNAAAVLDSEDHGISLSVTKTTTAEKLIQEVVKQIDGVLYENSATGKLELHLVRKIPDPSSLPLFNESNIERVVNYRATTWTDTFNEVRVKYRDRAQDYVDSFAVAQDLSNFVVQGNKKRSTTLEFIGVRTAALANVLAARELKALSIPSVTLQFVCNRQAVDLKPGDGIQFSYSKYNISNMVLRIDSIDFGTRDDNKISISCIQDKFDNEKIALFANPAAPPTRAGRTTPVPPVVGDVSEVPKWVSDAANADTRSGGTSEIALSLYGGSDEVSKGAVMYLTAADADGVNTHFNAEFSLDGLSYNRDAFVLPFTGRGAVLDEYPLSTGDYDTTTGLVIHNVNLADVLKTATAVQISTRGRNLIQVGTEIMSFESYTDLGGGSYRLNNVWRGLLDTSPVRHGQDESVWFIDDTSALGSLSVESGQDLQARSITSTAIKDLDTTLAQSSLVSIKGRQARPYSAANVKFKGSTSPAEVLYENFFWMSWDRRNRSNRVIVRGDAGDEVPAAFNGTATVSHVVTTQGDWEPDSPVNPPFTSAVQVKEQSRVEVARLNKLGGWGITSAYISVHDETGDAAGILYSLYNREYDVFLSAFRNMCAKGDFDRIAIGFTLVASDFWTTVLGTPAFTVSGMGAGSDNYFLESITSEDKATARNVIPLDDPTIKGGLDPSGLDALVTWYDRMKSADADDTVKVTVSEVGGAAASVNQSNIPVQSLWTPRELILSGLSTGADSLNVDVELDAVSPSVGIPQGQADHVDVRIGEFTSQLLLNPRFEPNLSTWTQASGTWRLITAPTGGLSQLRGSPSRYAMAPTAVGGPYEMYQVVSIPAGFGESDTAVLRWWQGQASPTDTGYVVLEALDASDVVLGSVQTTAEEITPEDTWDYRELQFNDLPATSAKLKVRIISTNESDVAWDEFSLRAFRRRIRYPRRSAHVPFWLESTANVASHMWRFNQDTSGANAPDLIGTEDLEDQGTPTQGNRNSELDSRVVAFTGGTSQRMEAVASTTMDVTTGSLAFLWIGEVPTIAGSRWLIKKFQDGSNYWGLLVNASGDLSFSAWGTSGGTDAILASALSAGDQAAVLCVLDRTAGTQSIHVRRLSSSTTVSASYTPSSTALGNTGLFHVGGNSSDAANAEVAMIIGWKGTAAEGLSATLLDNLAAVMDWKPASATSIIDADFTTPASQSFPISGTVLGATPTSGYTFDALIGNVVDRYGSNDLAPIAEPLQGQTAAGIYFNRSYTSKIAAEYRDPSSSFDAATNAVHDFTTGSFSILYVFRVGEVPAAETYLLGKRITAGYELTIDAAGNVKALVHDGTNSGSVTLAKNLADGAWHAVLMKVDRTADTLDLFTSAGDGAQANIAAVTGSLSNTAVFSVGEGRLNAAHHQSAYCLVFTGATAEGILTGDLAAWWLHGSDPTGLITTHTRASAISGPIADGWVGHFSGAPSIPQLPIVYRDWLGLGVGIHPVITNLVPDSEDLLTSWASPNESAKVAANSSNAPDGFRGADKVIALATNGYMKQDWTSVAATEYTLSVWIRRSAKDATGSLVFYDETGDVELASQAFTAQSTWTRVSATATTNAGQVLSSIRIKLDNANMAVLAWGAQAQTGSAATAYVRTFGAPASSAKTDIRIAGSSVRQDLGEIEVTGGFDAMDGYQFFAASPAAVADGRFIYTDATGQVYGQVYDSSGTIAADVGNAGTYVADTAYTTRLRWDKDGNLPGFSGDDADVYVDGVRQEADAGTFTSSGTFQVLHVGQSQVNGDTLNGVISKISSWLSPKP